MIVEKKSIKAKENMVKKKAIRAKEIRAKKDDEQKAVKLSFKDRFKMRMKKFFTTALFATATIGPSPKVNSGGEKPSSPDSFSKTAENIIKTPEKDDNTLYLSPKESVNEKIAELRKRNKMRADSLERASQKNIQLTGYDIKYEKGEYGDEWTVNTRDGNTFIGMEDLDYDAIAKIYREEHEKIFSKPLKYIDTTVSIKDFTIVTEDRVKPIYGGYNEYENTILIPHYTLEGKDELADSIVKVCHYSKEQADSLVMAMYNTVNNKESIDHTMLHEKTHHDDYEKGYFIPDLPLEYMYKLHMLKEIKANMTEGGMSLQDYEKDGKVSHFCWMNHEVDTLELQKKLPEVSDAETRKEVVGEYFFNKWLEEYNVENSVYTYQSMDMIWGGGVPVQQFFLMENINDDNKEFRQEYLRRVNEMFSDVYGLGDMRGVINPDFELNSQLSMQVDMMKTGGLKDLTKNSSTIAESYQRLEGLLKVVRDCDADGVRTQEEQDLINKTILNLREKAEQEGEKTQESQESSNQTLLLQTQVHER